MFVAIRKVKKPSQVQTRPSVGPVLDSEPRLLWHKARFYGEQSSSSLFWFSGHNAPPILSTDHLISTDPYRWWFRRPVVEQIVCIAAVMNATSVHSFIEDNTKPSVLSRVCTRWEWLIDSVIPRWRILLSFLRCRGPSASPLCFVIIACHPSFNLQKLSFSDRHFIPGGCGTLCRLGTSLCSYSEEI